MKSEKSRGKFKSIILTLIFLMFIGVFLYNVSRYRFFVDDAFISMRYSRHLYEGKGLVYNLGERVEGYSNFLWVLILALFGGLGFSITQISLYLGYLFSTATIVLAYIMIRRLNPGKPFMNLLPVVFLANNRTFVVWSNSGLETALFGFLLISFIYRLHIEYSGSRKIFSPFIAFLLTLTRPEGLLFSGLGFAFILCTYGNSLEEKKTLLKRWFYLYLTPFSIYLVWKIWYFGDVLPNTFYNKIGSGEPWLSRGIPYFKGFFLDTYAYLWFLLIFLTYKKRDYLTNLVLGLIIPYIAYTIWIGGDWMNFRLYLPLLAPIFIVFTLAINKQRARISTEKRVFFRRTQYLVLVCYVVATLILSSLSTYDEKWKPSQLEIYGTYKRNRVAEKRAIDVAVAMEKALDPDDVVAHSFAGFPGLYSDQHIIDTFGQTDAFVSHLPFPENRSPSWKPGHLKRATSSYLEEKNVVCINPWAVAKRETRRGIYSIRINDTLYLVCRRPKWISHEDFIQKFNDKGLTVYLSGEEV